MHSLSIHDLSGISLCYFVINNIIPTQALCPKPVSPSEKNFIANMGESPKFILAQTRNIQFEVKVYGRPPLTLHCNVGKKPA